MRLGVDVDGVCAAFAPLANTWLAQHALCAPKPMNEWNWFRQYPNGAELWQRMWRAFETEHLFVRCAVIPGAKEGLADLYSLGHEIRFITHRPSWAREDTERWLAMNLLDFGRLVVVDATADKVSEDVDVMLDDLADTVRQFRGVGKDAVLFKQPWNTPDWFTLPSVGTWREFVDGVRAY